jgi:hypothetical protein
MLVVSRYYRCATRYENGMAANTGRVNAVYIRRLRNALIMTSLANLYALSFRDFHFNCLLSLSLPLPQALGRLLVTVRNVFFITLHHHTHQTCGNS